nr:uncharacterized protein LOC107409408 [Ziziphus jujuba var. spinosa]
MALSLTSPDWAHLQADILGIILDKLVALSDYVRFGAVCKPWNSIASDHKHKQKRMSLTNQQLPWQLVITLDENGKEKLTLYAFSTSKLSNIKLRIPIPEKFNLMERPILGSFEVMAINMDHNVVAHLKFGDQVWTYSKTVNDGYFKSVTFYKDSILAACNGGIVSLEKINGGDTSDEKRHQSSLDIKICGELNPKLKKIYGSKGGFCLVESTKGDLLMVCQIDDSRHAFKIVELNGRFKHVPIANLDGHSLFVGKNHSILVLASKYPGCRPNSIYFSTASTEPWRLRHENNLKYEFKIQEFNLEDGSIRYYSTVETRTSFQNILAVAGPVPWIVPSMKF